MYVSFSETLSLSLIYFAAWKNFPACVLYDGGSGKLSAKYGVSGKLFVSHDEEFIRRAIARIVCFEHETLKTFEGGWEEMNRPQKKSRSEEDRKLEISRLEMQMAVLSARLSAPKKGDRPDLLREEYLRLAEDIRKLKADQ